MENKEMQLPLDLILKISSGRDSDGIPRSASAIGIEKILDDKKTENIAEICLEDAVTCIYQSGGAAILTFDFKYNALGIFRECKELCENWLKNPETNVDQQFSLTVAPYALTGQIILVFTNLMFIDGYDYKTEQNQAGYRLILGFDNNASFILETNEIDYAEIQHEITEDLRRYEEDIDEQLEKLAEEERKIKEYENQMNQNLHEKLNNPLDEVLNKEIRENEDKRVRFVEDNKTVRYTDD